ncbi:MAG: AHH domain-containing protein [Alteraurantiacibacter sp.]|nr:AHH domain-containing protein [Alteraurantiacibacter sp.]
MQRHHLIPRQLLRDRRLARLFDAVGRERIGLDDFRVNGLLLPSVEQAAMVLGLPLHRGPHRRYNEVVADRVGQIEQSWSRRCRQSPDCAAREVLMRMSLLQDALRRSLLQPAAGKMGLRRVAPLDPSLDFSELDAMAEKIWSATGWQRAVVLESRDPVPSGRLAQARPSGNDQLLAG